MKYIHKGADISDCLRYRYRLWRCWDESLPVCCFIMLNPSTADGERDDRTICQCVSFAAREGCGMLIVVNFFAYRTSHPKKLWSYRDGLLKGDIIGNPSNDAFIGPETQASHITIAAWGAQPQSKLKGRDKSVVELVTKHAKLYCLGTTKSGAPRHPCRLAKDTPLTLWRAP